MEQATIFINNLSWVFVLLFIMCLIGLAVFVGWLLIKRIEKEIDRATGKDWIDELFEDAYLNQADKIDKILEDIDKWNI